MNKCANTLVLATGKTLEEIDALFARSASTRERLEKENYDRRGTVGSIDGPPGRRGSQVSTTSNSHKMFIAQNEKA